MQDPIRQLHQKAHTAVDRRRGPSHGPSAPFNAELERLSGRTSLITEGVASEDDDNCTEMLSSERYFSEAMMDNVHPSLADDMRTYERGGPTFVDHGSDLEGSESRSFGRHHLQEEPDQHMQLDDHQEQHYFETAINGSYAPGNGSGYQTLGEQQHQLQPPPPLPSPPLFEQTAPILDGTWQSFVEQLGF